MIPATNTSNLSFEVPHIPQRETVPLVSWWPLPKIDLNPVLLFKDAPTNKLDKKNIHITNENLLFIVSEQNLSRGQLSNVLTAFNSQALSARRINQLTLPHKSRKHTRHEQIRRHRHRSRHH